MFAKFFPTDDDSNEAVTGGRCGTYENELRPNSLKDTKKGPSVDTTLRNSKKLELYISIV